MVNAKVVDDVKTLLHLWQYAELENRLITRIDHWRGEIISQIIDTNPDLPIEERHIILNRNTTPPADSTLSKPIDKWLQTQQNSSTTTSLTDTGEDIDPQMGSITTNNSVSIDDQLSLTLDDPQDTSTTATIRTILEIQPRRNSKTHQRIPVTITS